MCLHERENGQLFSLLITNALIPATLLHATSIIAPPFPHASHLPIGERSDICKGNDARLQLSEKIAPLVLIIVSQLSQFHNQVTISSGKEEIREER